jgi:shikimate kinase
LQRNNNTSTRIKPIFLMGFMGSGKTTLGRALHAATGAKFIDLDDAIEARAGTSIKEIFAAQGEAGFRRLETSTLADVANNYDIIACGGGTPCFGGNMELMNSIGTTVWLQAPTSLLVDRLILATANRPLIAGMSRTELQAYVEKTVAQRSPHYSKAQERFDASDLDSADGIARSVKLFAEHFLGK